MAVCGKGSRALWETAEYAEEEEQEGKKCYTLQKILLISRQFRMLFIQNP